MSRLAILIPAYNEEKTIKNVLLKLKKFKVYVVNDGSTDKTLEILKKFKNLKIFTNKVNLGYENSVIKGLNIIIKSNFEYIVTLDADGQHSLNKIEKLYAFALKTNADMIIGKRSEFNRLSEKILSFFFNIRYQIKDPISGFKLYKVNSLRKIIKKIKNDKTFLVKIVYIFIKKKYLIKNLNILVKKRLQSRVGNGLITNLKIIKLINYCLK